MHFENDRVEEKRFDLVAQTYQILIYDVVKHLAKIKSGIYMYCSYIGYILIE